MELKVGKSILGKDGFAWELNSALNYLSLEPRSLPF